MLTRLAGALLCRDPRCDCWPLPDLSGEAARGMASLRVDAALLDGEPVVRGAAARSFGKAALGDRGGIPFSNSSKRVFRSRATIYLANFWTKQTFVEVYSIISDGGF